MAVEQPSSLLSQFLFLLVLASFKSFVSKCVSVYVLYTMTLYDVCKGMKKKAYAVAL